MKVNKTQLREFLQKINHATIATILVETEPKMTKRNNPLWGKIKKRSRVNGVINFSYENSVNNQRLREANPKNEQELSSVERFHADLRTWGRRILGTPLVEHNGKYYLEMKVERVLDSGYYIGENIVDKSAVEKFLIKNTESTKQELLKPVILRDYSLDSLKYLIVNGELIEVEQGTRS